MIIGENGTAKTSLLQAIAMAAAGSREVNSLAKAVTGYLRDRRHDEAMEITATFGFLAPPKGVARAFIDRPPTSRDADVQISSTVKLPEGSSSLHARSRYSAPRMASADPLTEARDKNLRYWFVAGYGIARALPDASQRLVWQKPSIERMEPLFPGSRAGLTSTAFADYLSGAKNDAYRDALNSVLFRTKRLLPRISALELRRPGDIQNASDLAEQNRILQRVGAQDLAIPTAALSHGYQSTIAWIADLVGHIILDAEIALQPDDMQGLVLIDEIDLYLHPTWQIALISALRETFPQVQFVATTHSPLVLAGMHPTEIVRLQFADNGDVERAPIGDDARIMTATEIYREYFGIDDIIPDPTGQKLRSYRYLAANPYRSDSDDSEMTRLRDELLQLGVDPAFDPVPRAAP